MLEKGTLQQNGRPTLAAHLVKLLLQRRDLGLFGAQPAAAHHLRGFHVGRDLPASAHALPLDLLLGCLLFMLTGGRNPSADTYQADSGLDIVLMSVVDAAVWYVCMYGIGSLRWTGRHQARVAVAFTAANKTQTMSKDAV